MCSTEEEGAPAAEAEVGVSWLGKHATQEAKSYYRNNIVQTWNEQKYFY